MHHTNGVEVVKARCSVKQGLVDGDLHADDTQHGTCTCLQKRHMDTLDVHDSLHSGLAEAAAGLTIGWC
jgi:hypothetical protein